MQLRHTHHQLIWKLILWDNFFSCDPESRCVLLGPTEYSTVVIWIYGVRNNTRILTTNNATSQQYRYVMLLLIACKPYPRNNYNDM